MSNPEIVEAAEPQQLDDKPSVRPSHGGELLLAARQIRVWLGRNEILRGIDLELSAGQVVGVLGPNGAGKSTLFRVLVGELVPDEGSVWLEGRNVTRAPLWKRARLGLAYVPQTPSVLFDLSVADNVETFRRVAGATDDLADRLTSALALRDLATRRARELSGGERRRLELLRALLLEPRLLVLDEPLAGLDAQAAQTVLGLLRARAMRGGAVLLADHRVSELLAVCDRAALLVDGRVEVTDEPARFADHPAVQRRYLT